jgi:single-strand DNA-binding protein
MLNKAILMGRLVADPELRRTPNNNSVTSFTLAVNRSFTRQGEQPQTDFIDIVAWGKTAEFVSRYFVKGQQVAVAGRIQTRNWEDKQGNKRKSVEVVAEEVHFAESKRDSQSRNDLPQGGFDPMAGLGGNAFAALPGDDNDLPF